MVDVAERVGMKEEEKGEGEGRDEKLKMKV